MNEKLFRKSELAGAAAAAVGSFMLLNLYDLTGNSPIGVMFGAVNQSPWELMKTVVLSYFVISGVVLFAARPPFHRFAAAGAFGMYSSAVFFIVLVCLGLCRGALLYTAIFAAQCVGFSVSCFLCARCPGIREWFPVACFMLMLMFVMYISFTAFPPRLWLFMDMISGRFGIFS